MLIASLILIQIAIFGVLIFILRRILTQNIVLATKHLEELTQELADKEKKISRQLEEVKQKSQEVLNKAREEAEGIRTQIVKEAETEKEKVLKQAHTQGDEIIQQADRARQLLLAEVDGRIAKEAVDRACELIQNTLPEQFKKDAHKQWVDDLIESSFNQLDRLQINRDIQEVKVVSAFPLNEKQRSTLYKRLKEVLDRSIKLKEEVDQEVVVGLVINIGSLVLDGSLRNRIREKARDVKHVG